MRLRAGRIGGSTAWNALFDQEGFPWTRVESPGDLSMDRFSVAAADMPLDGPWAKALRGYVEGGGAALVAPETLAAWVGARARWARFRSLVPAEGSRLRACRRIDLPGRALHVPGAGELLTDRGRRVLPIVRLGRGFVASFPLDPGRCLVDRRVRRRFFESPASPPPSERVSRVPRGEVRQMFRGTLRVLHHLRGMVYAHLWYFPGGSASVFGLRIDTDFAERREVSALYGLVREFGIPATWFLHVKAHVGWLRDFCAMEGQEIGIHGYEHVPPGRDARRLREDTARARDLLRGAGMGPEGFAAPYGGWTADIPAVLASLGLRYSSEFALDHDNLPSFAGAGGEGGGIVQVPVHPISIGNLRVCGYGPEEMAAYYAAAIERKLGGEEPVFFYTHPGEGRIPVLRALLSGRGREAFPAISLGDYAAWWRGRHDRVNRTEIRVEGEEISIEDGEGGAGRFRVAVRHPTKGRALVVSPLQARVADLPWSPEPVPAPRPASVAPSAGKPLRRGFEDLRAFLWRRRR